MIENALDDVRCNTQSRHSGRSRTAQVVKCPIIGVDKFIELSLDLGEAGHDLGFATTGGEDEFGI